MIPQSTRRCPKCQITPLKVGTECVHCISRRIQEETINQTLKMSLENYYKVNTYLNRIQNCIQKHQNICKKSIQSVEYEINYNLQRGSYIRDPQESKNPGPQYVSGSSQPQNEVTFVDESEIPNEEFVLDKPVICPICQKSFDEKPGFTIGSDGRIVHNDCNLLPKQ